MNEQPKTPPTSEKSLSYIAWDVKNITKEFQRLNDNIAKIAESLLNNQKAPF